MKAHLAEVNIARMRAPADSPIMAEFVAALDEMNALAERSAGFVWRYQTPQGNAMELRAYDDPLILFNLSVWETVDALKAYAFRTLHGRFFARRADWFEPMTESHLALWWIPVGTLPTVAEAKSRLEYQRRHGDTPRAFGFQHLFPIEAALADAGAGT